MAFTLQDFQNQSTILDVYSKMKPYFRDTCNELEVAEIYKSKEESANFWKRAFSYLTQHLNTNVNNLSPEQVTDYFNYDLIKYVFAYSNVAIGNAQEYFYKKYPYLELLQAIRISTSQWHGERLKGNKAIEVFNIMERLPSPFDMRFRAVPVHTASIRKGFDYSTWLQQESGGFNPYDKTIRFDSSFRNNYLDSKYGILIFFKDKPSILISFLIDNENNLYIHQIQSQIKDRGHYKLGAEWREKVISYIETLFPRHNTHIIDGFDSAKMAYDCYCEEVEQEFKPDPDTIKRIEKSYNELRPAYRNSIQAFGLNYRSA